MSVKVNTDWSRHRTAEQVRTGLPGQQHTEYGVQIGKKMGLSPESCKVIAPTPRTSRWQRFPAHPAVQMSLSRTSLVNAYDEL